MTQHEGARPRRPDCEVPDCAEPPGAAIFPMQYGREHTVWLCDQHRAAYDQHDTLAQVAVFMIIENRH